MPQRLNEYGRAFRYFRVAKSSDVPAADPRCVDLAILDMNHGWPNLGHDCLVRAVGEVAEDLEPLLDSARLSVRVLSYDVRGSLMVPEAPGRHRIYLGTGGPGHIDPHRNDGKRRTAQGIRENPAWEKPLFRLYDAIMRDSESALLAVCHTFGTLCRWSGVARPRLRSRAKGGKSSGVKENVLSNAGRRHPWFRRLAEELPDGRHFSVVDNRLFDLLANPGVFKGGISAIGYETEKSASSPVPSLTMVEMARDTGGVMPRILAVNHHPEIRDRRRQKRVLDGKLARREVTRAWYEERVNILSEAFARRESEQQVTLTSQYTLLAPLRFHLYRQVRLRLESIGRTSSLHEDRVLVLPSGILDREDAGDGEGHLFGVSK